MSRGREVSATSRWGLRGILTSAQWDKGDFAYLSYAVRVLREQLGDYGYITAGSFRCEGNILSEFKSRSPISDIALRQHIIDCDKPDSYYVTARPQRRWLRDRSVTVYKPRALLLPSNDHFYSFLASLPTTIRLTNKYLVTTVVQCDQFIEDCGIFGGSHTCESVPTSFILFV